LRFLLSHLRRGAVMAPEFSTACRSRPSRQRDARCGLAQWLALQLVPFRMTAASFISFGIFRADISAR